MNGDLRRIRQHLLQAAAPTVPFVVHCTASAAAFTLGLGFTQVAGYACRISCATPVLGSAVGLLGVGMASAMAGQASLQCQRYYGGASALALHRIRRQDVLVDAVVGIALWKALGGRFRSVMPSDLFAPGAMAVESLPSPGSQYASEVSRGELARLFRRDGCHHCGTKKGQVVGDHIPPNRMVWGSSKEVLPAAVQKQLAKGFGFAQLGRSAKSTKVAMKREPNSALARMTRRLKAALAIEPSMPKQRYYPQCRNCSGRQSTAVKKGQRTLVLHFGGPKAPYYAGIIVGLQHYMARPMPPFGGSGGWSGASTPHPAVGGHDSFGLRTLFSLPLMLGDKMGQVMIQAGSRFAQENEEEVGPGNSMHLVSRCPCISGLAR